MFNDPLVSIIIPSITPEKAIKLLDSLTRSDYGNIEIILVFDYVRKIPEIDDSIKRKFRSFIIIANDKPLLKSGSVNKGIKRAKADYIIVIDEDNIALENTINNLLVFMEKHPLVGIAQPLVYTLDGKLQHYGGFWNRHFGIFEHYIIDNEKEYMYVELLTDCLIIRKKVINDIGYFSTEIPWGDDDAELCIRAKKGGWYCAVVLTAKIFHDKKLGVNIKNIYDILHSKVTIQLKYYRNEFLFYPFILFLIMYFGIFTPLKQREFKSTLKYLLASINGAIDGFRRKYNIKLIRGDSI